MKLADVCTKAFGMPLNDPAYPAGTRFCCGPVLVIQETNR
jgi:acetoacetate decarboxylase